MHTNYGLCFGSYQNVVTHVFINSNKLILKIMYLGKCIIYFKLRFNCVYSLILTLNITMAILATIINSFFK